jgi:SAM-dependent methyltransferase
MEDYWDNKYREIKTQWGFEPSDSAVRAKDFFIQHNINDILIPGVGFGRNAGIFLDNGINVTGIEISETAIKLARDEYHKNFRIYHGSVTGMPFDQKLYGGVFCYALIHLLNKPERIKFIQSCYNQLLPGGYMIFIVVSKKSDLYGRGRLLSCDRFEISKGLKVYFYDKETATNEFKNYGLIEIKEIDEPVKHMVNEPPMKLIMIKCKL